MGRSAVQILKGCAVHLPMLAGAGLLIWGLLESTAGPMGGVPGLVLVMLGMAPIIVYMVFEYYQGRALALLLSGLLVLAAGAVEGVYLREVLVPAEREELSTVEGTYASMGVIPIYRAPDDYRIRLQQDGRIYRGFGFLDFPAERIEERAQRGDQVEILYKEGARYGAIYGFRLNGDDLLSYETSLRARRANQGLWPFTLVLPALVCLGGLIGAVKCRFGRSRRRGRSVYRYTGRRFWRR
ncbi:MAG: hypothetical protein HFF90_05140 [Oscillibacter sp.]|nr:hypothetical protein [Oscillibacter sp.]